MSQNTKTDGNLKTAFAGESQAKRRYLLFAEKADKEGYSQIARLFRAASAAENVHARRHFEAMGTAGSTMDSMTAAVTSNTVDEAGSTKDNLTVAVTGEHYEFTKMYPSFTKEAEKEDNLRAQISFDRAKSVEQIHHKLFEATIKALEAKQPIKSEPYFVCGVCGYTVAGEAPEKCPICGALRVRFTKVD
ncbi:MAG: rubrerythrin family protein [Dehalococcoidales bacterium]|nr:rubrerythrin family protein [Dehalococcoidales bacterium]